MQIGSTHKTPPKTVVTSASSFWKSNEVYELTLSHKELKTARETTAADPQDRLEIGGILYQEPASRKISRTLKRGGLAALPALGALGLAAAGALTGLPGVLAFGVLALTSLANGATLASDWKAAASDIVQAKEQEKEGLTGLQAWHSELKVDLPVTAESPPEEGLKAMLTANMQHYPTSFHLVHLNGHGYGARQSAGLSGSTLAESLEQASLQGQRPTDVLVLETCYGANFEQLLRFGPTVKYVVAFEDQIPNGNSQAGRIPLANMLTSALEEETPATMAREIARVAGAHFDQKEHQGIAKVPHPQRTVKAHRDQLRQGTDSTAVAIDLEALENRLAPALDTLGQGLLSRWKSDREFRALVRESKDQNYLDKRQDLLDLGGLLAGISQRLPTEDPLQENLEIAQRALESAILEKRTGSHYPLSGLSIHSRPNKAPLMLGDFHGGPSSHPTSQNERLPANWMAFVEASAGPHRGFLL